MAVSSDSGCRIFKSLYEESLLSKWKREIECVKEKTTSEGIVGDRRIAWKSCRKTITGNALFFVVFSNQNIKLNKTGERRESIFNDRDQSLCLNELCLSVWDLE